MIKGEKWFLMMEFCQENGWNPSSEYYWELAEKAYDKINRS